MDHPQYNKFPSDSGGDQLAVSEGSQVHLPALPGRENPNMRRPLSRSQLELWPVWPVCAKPVGCRRQAQKGSSQSAKSLIFSGAVTY